MINRYTNHTTLTYLVTWSALFRDSVTASVRSSVIVGGVNIKLVVSVMNLGPHFDINNEHETAMPLR